MPESGHTYFIINKKSGTAFALSAEDQRSVIVFTLDRGDNQKARSTVTPRSLPAIDLILICSGPSANRVANGLSRTATPGNTSMSISRTQIVTVSASLLSAL